MREIKTSRKFALATLPKKQQQKLQDVLTVKSLAVLKAVQFPLTYLALSRKLQVATLSKPTRFFPFTLPFQQFAAGFVHKNLNVRKDVSS